MEKIDLSFETVVLKNYAVYQKSEKDNILQNALPFVDNFLLNKWHCEILIAEDFLQRNKDIENWDDIKRLNNKYKKLVEQQINSRI